MDVTHLSPGRRALFDLSFFGMLVALPALTWYMTICMLHYDGALVVPDAEFLGHIAAPTWGTVGLYVAWLLFQALLQLYAPGRVVEGEPLADGRRLPYRMNGLVALLLTVAAAAGAVWAGWIPAGYFFLHLEAFITTTNLVVLLGCVGLLVLGRAQADGKERRLNLLEAYFVGATLNPRVGRLDLKFFCESRPGMILWVLIDLSLAAAQHKAYGAVSDSMILVCLFQIWYVTDYFLVEDAILTTWDIRHENFGFMLGWGSLVWVPFTYSLQALYLVSNPIDLPTWAVVGLVVLNFTGYFIFRTSNLQKHRFRRDPERPIWGRKPEYIETARGTRLLTSGWWGVARHANYLGDLMMGLAWCLTCGFERILPYFYIIYFTILLVHREWRDGEHCASKYGFDWQRYTARVRWRIVPWVY